MQEKLQRLINWYSPGYATVHTITDATVTITYHSGGDWIKTYPDLTAAVDEIETLIKNFHDQLKQEIADLRCGEYGLE